MSDDSLYRAEFLRRSQNLKHTGVIDSAVSLTGSNPLCGDEQTISLKIEKDTIKQIKFQPKGCMVSQVATDILIEAISGKSRDDVLVLAVEDIEALMGSKLTPSRRKCASLGLKTIQDYLQTA